MGRIVVAVGPGGLSESVVATVERLAGSGEAQVSAVTVVHVAKVWGSGLGLQHPALQPSAAERDTAQRLAARAALELCERGVDAEALVTSGRDMGKALAAVARRAGADLVVVGRGRSGRLNRLLRGPDPARRLLDLASCTIVVVA